ncbi:hypothetical protein ABZ929_23040 [Streptomyces physcomitrii]|uniref:hypothetical protein n=1 Tax=Streptomyces physcomitrii TaxID=2724184 RepID=UPI003426A382
MPERDRKPSDGGRARAGAPGRAAAEEEEESGRGRRLDLNLPQVAGGAVAAVVAAKLAANLGVYGTILGAGVVSVVATCGGTLFQHFFRRTGEQIREVAVQAKPKSRQVPVTSGGEPVPPTFRPDPAPPPLPSGPPALTTWGTAAAGGAAAGGTPLLRDPAADRTRLLPRVTPEPGGDRTPVPGLPPGESAPGEDPGRDATRLLTGVAPGPFAAGSEPRSARYGEAGQPYRDGRFGDPDGPRPDDGFGAPSVHRARRASLKRPLLATAAVFALTMGGITAYEFVSGQSLDGGRGGTTVGDVVSGGGHRSDPAPRGPADTGEEPSDSGSQDGGSPTPEQKETPGKDGAPEGHGANTPSPGASRSQRPGESDPNGSSPEVTGDGDSTPAPEPSGGKATGESGESGKSPAGQGNSTSGREGR